MPTATAIPTPEAAVAWIGELAARRRAISCSRVDGARQNASARLRFRLSLGVALLAAVSVTNGQTARPADATSRTARKLEQIRSDAAALRAFLLAMPKGADLHTHLTGAVYAESYLRWAAELGLCVDITTSTVIETCSDSGRHKPATEAVSNPRIFRDLVDAMSTRHWRERGVVGHYQFFDTFPKFNALTRIERADSAEMSGRFVAEVVGRAGRQNVLHVELMMALTAGSIVERPDTSWESDDVFGALRQRMIERGLPARVAGRRAWLDRVEAHARTRLGCGTAARQPGCDLSVKYIAYAQRGQPPETVFAQAVFAFELAAADPRIVGVNLVMPEDWPVPMRDYDLHMRMFRALRQLHPAVPVSLHAGELSLGLVPPESLGSHVRSAIKIGGARRIGHATDIMNDTDPAGLLREMKQKGIAVEVSLTSSDVILGVRGSRHPLRQLLRAGVPVVLATDDEGVSRTDLTNEYQRAVEEQGLSYAEIKAISRHSIDYSFLPNADKVRLRRQLDAAFQRFEARHR